MKGPNAKVPVQCAECGAALLRRPLRPKDGRPIGHFYCAMPCKAAWQRRQKPVAAEWLRQKYEVEGLSANDIAEIVGRDPKRVWEWLRDVGVQTRKRGTNPNVHFKPGVGTFAGQRHSEATKAKLRQIRRADGRYPRKQDGSPAMRGVTGAAHPNWQGGITPERQAFYASRQWKDACRTVWGRAGGTCERCGHRHVRHFGRTMHVHHVAPFRVRELRAQPDNLRLVCKPCHLFIHSRKNTAREMIGGTP